MSNPFFRFKKFTIRQDRCAMKVGTDGVLLGAWVGLENTSLILDIGTGTGLIALMLAQKTNALIDCLEVDQAAALQAKENCVLSPWQDQLFVHPVSLQEFQPTNGLYDLIVTNPPYFINASLAANKERTLARHSDSLTSTDLLNGVNRLLAPSGRFGLILPIAEYELFCREAKSFNLFEIRRTQVIPAPDKIAKRIMAEFSSKQSTCISNEIVIEKYGRHRYSEEYIELTREFYFNF